ncbi:ABC transporter substrate-binding protein [Paenibacillus mendelii]|uniref:ABC transporter substrate-binding protein n=1 Tax=Paenibacillus mendelii TaxID=206163 RepID=A0ABV6JB16_9BACL|nr:ABC transporter substrate-binding protein [Paenibacillus mendelii]MCQ6562960.1 ABC transporter substrate-binding protein [Paenibacillus mendelii]
MFKRKLIGRTIVLLSAILLLSACSSNNGSTGNGGQSSSNTSQNGSASSDKTETNKLAAPSNLAEKGKLTYGTAATFPPFEYMNNNEFVGFDIEMGQALAEQMGLEVEIRALNFEGLIPALQGKRIDMINSAMYIKPEREAQVDFVPYMKLGDSIVVKTGNKLGIKTMDDLSTRTVAVTRGAVEEIFVKEHNKKLKDAGKPEIKVLALPTANDSVLATQQDRADAFLTSSPGAAYLQEELPGVFEIASTFEANTTIGMAVRKGDTEVKNALEAALLKLAENGTYASLMEKYHLPVELSYFE